MLITKSIKELSNDEFYLPADLGYKESYFQQTYNRLVKLFNNPNSQDSKFELRPYQVKAAAHYLMQARNISGASQGLGKTLISTLIIKHLYFRMGAKLRPGLVHIVLHQSTGLNRWMEELKTFLPTDEVAFIYKKSDLAEARGSVWIYTQDFLKIKLTKSSRGFVSRKLTKFFKPSLLVIDEVHHYTNPKSIKYRELSILSRSAKRVLGLSGTITEGQLRSLDAVFNLVYQKDWKYFRQPKALEKSLATEFKMRADYQSGEACLDSGRTLQTVNLNDLPNYFEIVRKYLHRISIDDPTIRASIKSMPTAQDTRLTIDLSTAQKNLYLDYQTQHKAQIDYLAQQACLSGEQQVKYRALMYPLIEICNTNLDFNQASPKAQLCLDSVSLGKKTAVFCQYVNSARYITNLLKDSLGADKVIRVYGKDDLVVPKNQSPADRWNAINKFEQDANVLAGVFSLNLAAEAIDLVAADQIIFYCLPWAATKIDQALRRVVRPGNKNKIIDVYFITHNWGIDKYQLALLDQKLQIAKVLLDYDSVDVVENSLESLPTIDNLLEIFV